MYNVVMGNDGRPDKEKLLFFILQGFSECSRNVSSGKPRTTDRWKEESKEDAAMSGRRSANSQSSSKGRKNSNSDHSWKVSPLFCI
jgi:hypothetical protein